MVEQEAVNFEVTGSSPVAGAMKIVRPFGLAFFIVLCLIWTGNSPACLVIVTGSAQCSEIKMCLHIFISKRRRL